MIQLNDILCIKLILLIKKYKLNSSFNTLAYFHVLPSHRENFYLKRRTLFEINLWSMDFNKLRTLFNL